LAQSTVLLKVHTSHQQDWHSVPVRLG